MAWGQGELFPTATERETQRAKFLLGKYTEMIALIKDFQEHEQELKQVAIDGEVARRIDQEDMHADKDCKCHDLDREAAMGLSEISVLYRKTIQSMEAYSRP